MNERFNPLLLAATMLLGAVCVAGGAAIGTSNAAVPATGETNLRILDWQTRVPRGWVAEAPSSSMRLAQLRVPGAQSAAAAELVVFYFGPGQGGPVQANIERWSGQFSAPDGKAVAPEVSSERGATGAITHVELSGTYARGIGAGSTDAARPGQTLIASIVETPKGNLTFQLWGPRDTVAANRDAYLAVVRGLH